ncbi:semaphorin-like protein [Variola virus]|uniref:Semaphorin-like protein n=1 Tax=Variola virus TaxID=10255 RepID=Q0NE82_VARV|nr:semaphorin-like protein [Variola virus]
MIYLYTADNVIPKDGLQGAFVDKDGTYDKVYILFTVTIDSKRIVKIPYIAQMCLNDECGPSSLSSHRWSTLLKVELECDIDGRSYSQINHSKTIKQIMIRYYMYSLIVLFQVRIMYLFYEYH